MELKHSGMGIASFIVSIVGSVSMLVLFVMAGLMAAKSPGGMDETAVQTVILGLLVIIMFFVNLVALGLGIAGAFQKERKKVFAILGMIFSVITVVVTAALMIIGSAVR